MRKGVRMLIEDKKKRTQMKNNEINLSLAAIFIAK